MACETGGVTHVAGARQFSAVGALRGVGSFAVAGVGLSLLGRVGVGVGCPWRALTGTLCPLCGSTHLGMALLRLDVAGAWAANPFVFGVLVGVGVLTVLWTVEALGGPAARLPRPFTRSVDRWWLALGVLALTWGVLRNVW